eukprot:CAMPEP_0113632030 /NCGR_PEP_ID=MMETSP0017_2-20120614/16646_1 /TAXON_ID=2856 /ORGANISM="Cylindrotheca closterium" /LENGTH=327 /DNA_ID=CAMNT_0000542565 /DNA_START=245 /DNA_END=1228 /DNA_ORIENTATION=+ /assembly_acc=CAM_ASM_000147
MSEPSDGDLKKAIAKLIPTVNLHNTGIKAFIKLLSAEFGGADLKSKNGFIKKELEEAINAMSTDEESEEEEEKVEVKPKKAKGLAQKKKISDKLAAFLGKGDTMARTEIVKALWEYIRANNLQHPENKREIVLDEKMKEVFGCDQFSMFTMNKYISVHVDPFKPLDLTTKPKPEKKKTKRKRGGDKDGKPKAKRKAGAQPPYRLSPELQAVVNKEILPRPQVVKAIWVYIKAHGLQNPENKREILCDDKLKAIMAGREKVTMFNMNSFVGEHLVEKLDKSAYQHAEEEVVEEVKVAAAVAVEEDDDDEDVVDEEGSETEDEGSGHDE